MPSAGRPSAPSQARELEYWEGPGIAEYDLHLRFYRRVFAFESLDFGRATILDVGSGPISVFEKLAPASARIVGYDTLADDYNRIAPSKTFPISRHLPDARFTLITLFNCLDHMDAPGELLAALAERLDTGGRLWIYCHVDRPFDPVAHPQDFRFWDLVNLVERHVRIEACGLTREGRLFPYAWWAVARTREPGEGNSRRVANRLRWIASCGLAYARFHGVRALVKGVKLAGLRRLLPEPLRF